MKEVKPNPLILLLARKERIKDGINIPSGIIIID